MLREVVAGFRPVFVDYQPDKQEIVIAFNSDITGETAKGFVAKYQASQGLPILARIDMEEPILDAVLLADGNILICTSPVLDSSVEVIPRPTAKKLTWAGEVLWERSVDVCPPYNPREPVCLTVLAVSPNRELFAIRHAGGAQGFSAEVYLYDLECELIAKQGAGNEESIVCLKTFGSAMMGVSGTTTSITR